MTRGAGDRIHVVDVQAHNGKVENNQPTLERDEDWLPVIRGVPVSFKDVSGGETIRGRQMEADTTGLVELVWSPSTAAITPQMRLVMNGRKLNIVNVLDLEGTRRTLTIQVKEQR